MVDFLFRRGNPTNSWTRAAGLTLKVDLLEPSLNSVPLGSSVDQFSFLGRSSNKESLTLEFNDLGVWLDHETDGTISGFQISLDGQTSGFSLFKGELQLNKRRITAADLERELGEPYWRDQDEEEILLFYEFPSHEIVVEQALNGTSRHVNVIQEPSFADPEQRKAYGVTKSWPPF